MFLDLRGSGAHGTDLQTPVSATVARLGVDETPYHIDKLRENGLGKGVLAVVHIVYKLQKSLSLYVLLSVLSRTLAKVENDRAQAQLLDEQVGALRRRHILECG
jgi:hypothetical protein